jgi:hypothetical protein
MVYLLDIFKIKLVMHLVKNAHAGCLNPFMIFNELESGLKTPCSN